MTSLRGNHVEILDPTAQKDNGVLLPRAVYIDGLEILLIAEDGIRVETGGYENATTVTITFMPASVTIRGDLDG